ncbi:MAG: ABC transporter permease [Candidatus Aminicenantes bacterium]|nr:ABC transporter permease [Candidatus Aminicenantes bacterium]
MALFILAVLFTDIHFRFDRFHSDADRIYALVRTYSTADNSNYHTMKIPAPILPIMKDKFLGIEDATRFFHESGRVIRRDEKKFYEDRVWYGDPNFFSFFSFDLISGNPETVLESPNSVVITESMALKYFGAEDPVGHMLTINRNGVTELMVTGICKDIPVNSSLQFDFLVSSKTFSWLENWDVECTAFFKFAWGSDPLELEGKLPAFVESSLPDLQRHGEQLTMFPLTQIHIHSWHIMHHFQMQSLHPILLFGVLGTGIVLLLIVMVNFMNLSTARYMNRVKEVGLRKVVGASRIRLIQQFLGESVLISICTLPVALCFYEFIRPTFLSYVGLNTDLSIWKNPVLMLILLTMTIVVGLCAGSYPAFFLSAFKPISILKEHTFTGIKGSRVRKILVIVQFTLSILLIVFSLAMRKQFLYLSHLDLGYDRSHVVVLEVHPEMFNRLETLKQELLRHPKITAVGGANGYPFNWGHEEDIQTEGMSDEDAFPMKTYHVDYGFIEALDIKVTRGRSFSRNFADTHAYVLSKMAVKRFGWEDPIGKSLRVGGQEGTVIGVVEDFHFQHVVFEWEPGILYLEPGWTHHLFIRLTSPPNGDLRPFVERQWRAIAPDFPFEYSTLENAFQIHFRMLIKVSEVFRFISIVSLFISCLGLIGLASFTAEQKTQEIGIRKVLGATIPSLLRMLISEFMFFVIVANCIAIPIALWGSHLFLKSFWVGQANLGSFIFILASSLSFVAALASVIFQSLKVATANPVEALRYE